MAKKSSIAKQKHRTALVAQKRTKRAELKAIIMNQSLPPEDRFQATLKLAEMPRNSARNRLRNRCELTGRPRAFYRKFRICRNELRRLASLGKIPGMTKSSW